ncbi:hypothetical protein N6G94_04860 [Pediococcus inopinatus]|uniref:hypothetical protein n=1 Tax=Pediococcus inopinatus TaxID=114090 RepID=UPI002B261E38|nr:hypothetical protein [Pediococcus inopinatus]WPC18329.1 hypothetical protein N6G94_04860 [Pediococcus inopinatus]
MSQTVELVLPDDQREELIDALKEELVPSIAKASTETFTRERYKNKKDICMYLGIGNNTFDKYVAAHVPSVTFGKKSIYDCKAVDAYMKQCERFY